MNWINIKDRQPEEDQEVVFATKIHSGFHIGVGLASSKDNIWTVECNESFNEIHYWMPIEDLTSTLPQ